ncbi:transmembrane protein 109 [Apteryx rowi]|uniref:transmembrane protein 109 n=1 Tax=Apteryx rowi TaxID=308060 RepID=UPI000E1DBB96|nr:transmembrane protein 109 [Apteryx rowi]XP_025911190.1 transmembrane protein 109 [Apteryx rowi]
MGSDPWRRLLLRAVLALLLGATFLGTAAGRVEDGQEGSRRQDAVADDLLSWLGRAARDTLETWVGREPLQLVAKSLSAVLWTVSSGISVALATLCKILGDVLTAFGLNGDILVQSVSLGPGEVQKLLLWGLALLLSSWLLARLLGLALDLLEHALWWVKLCCFLRAFCYIVVSQENPTAQAGMLLGLWVLYALLGRLAGARGPSAELEATVRSLEWKVEELRRRQKWGGPRNREEE